MGITDEKDRGEPGGEAIGGLRLSMVACSIHPPLKPRPPSQQYGLLFFGFGD